MACKSRALVLPFDQSQLTFYSRLALASSCPKLKVLNISHCELITDGPAEDLQNRFLYLEKINAKGVRNISDAGVSSFFLNEAVRCKSMDFSNIDRLTDRSLYLLSRSRSAMVLREIVLMGCAITDAGIIILSQGCKNLFLLNVQACHEVSSDGIRVLASNCKFLQSVSLAACNNVCDRAIFDLVLKAKMLRYLDIHMAFGVSEKCKG